MNSENVTRRRNTDASLESHIFGPHDRRYSTAGSNIHRLSMKLQNSQFIENHFGHFFFSPINLQPEIKTEKKKSCASRKNCVETFQTRMCLTFKFQPLIWERNTSCRKHDSGCLKRKGTNSVEKTL